MSRRRALKVVLTGVGYFGLARAGLLFVEQPEGVAALWPAAGYMLGILLLSERREWPALLAAAGAAVVAANLVEGVGLGVSLAFAAVNVGESLLAAWLLERAVSAPVSLASPRACIAFALAAVLTTTVAAFGGAAVAVAGFDAPYWQTWLLWWTADGVGMLALVPLLLGLRATHGAAMSARRVAEAVVVLAVLAGVCMLVFSGESGSATTMLDLPVLTLPLLLLGAVRYDSRVLGVMIATLAGISALYTVNGSGPFADPANAVTAHVLELQAFLLIAIGTALAIVAIMSERRRIAAALTTSEERAREVVEGAHEAFVSIDVQGRIIAWNSEAERVFGWRRDEAVGRELAETIIPEEIRPAHRAGLRRFLATGEGRVMNQLLELSALHRDGHEFPVELTISAQLLGDEWVFNAFIRDVTERRRNEQAARDLAAIVESSDDAIISKTLEGEITSWNRGAERVYGYAPGEAIGRPMSILAPPERRDEVDELLERVRRGETVHNHETERVRKNGRRIHVSLTISPMRDADGEVRDAAVVARDVTARIRAERERERIADELERSNEELEQFAYIASHDLNEPLRVIGGFVQLLQRRYEGRLDERADHFIEATVDGVERMQTMIDALLEYSRVGQAGVGAELVDCDRAVQEAGSSLHRLISDRHAELQVSHLPTISGEPALISQLFQNLIANAVKYGDPERPSVEVKAERSNGDWVFSVEDNGGGIDPKHQERVFEMFKRLHGRDQAGTGIGLAICKRIVEKHGGRIWVEPRDAGGSAFRFAVPDRAGRS